MIDRINHLESLQLHLEHDDGFDMSLTDPEIVEEIRAEKIVVCGDCGGDRVYEGLSYVWVDPDYQGQLSPGQQKLYELLVSVQSASVYTMTTIGKLAEAQGLNNPLACAERLGNLQALGAIHGLKI